MGKLCFPLPCTQLCRSTDLARWNQTTCDGFSWTRCQLVFSRAGHFRQTCKSASSKSFCTHAVKKVKLASSYNWWERWTVLLLRSDRRLLRLLRPRFTWTWRLDIFGARATSARTRSNWYDVLFKSGIEKIQKKRCQNLPGAETAGVEHLQKSPYHTTLGGERELLVAEIADKQLMSRRTMDPSILFCCLPCQLLFNVRDYSPWLAGLPPTQRNVILRQILRVWCSSNQVQPAGYLRCYLHFLATSVVV